jgi:hypothetical protein
MMQRKKVTPFECYQDYLALKQHFTRPDYDYVKYNGKVRVNASSFDGRKDKIFFMKLSKHPDAHNFILSNMLRNPKLWVRDIAYNEESQRVYDEWQRKVQSLSYFFADDLGKLDSNFDDNLKVVGGQHPRLMKLYLKGDISLETLVILVDLTGCLDYWNKRMEGDPVWDEVGLLISKYSSFLKYDEQKMRNIVIDKFGQ